MQALAKIVLVVVSTLLITVPAQSAYMLGNPGWEPLTLDYLNAHNIDPSFMDEVLDGGGEYTCVWKKTTGVDSFSTLNAWYFASTKAYVLTNAHALYDQDDGKISEHFESCYTASNRGTTQANFDRYRLSSDMSTFRIGGANPLGDNSTADRALVPIVGGFPLDNKGHAIFQPLNFPADLEAITSEICEEHKTEVFLVASGRGPTGDPRVGEIVPRIQQASIYQLDKAANSWGLPAKLVLKADWHHGDSASMVLFRDQHKLARLVPIALLVGGAQETLPNSTVPLWKRPGIDGNPFDPVSNYANAILFDAEFFQFDLTAKGVQVSGLPSINQGEKSTESRSYDCIVGRLDR